jgi:hypothetical protein
LNDQSDQNLKNAIAGGELSPRKHAIAKEVLRRRHDIRGGGRLWTYVWLPLIGVLSVARFALQKLQARK